MLLPHDPLVRLWLGNRQVAARFGTLLVLTACGAGATAADRAGVWGWIAGLATAAVVLAALALHLVARLAAGARLGSSSRRAHLTAFGIVPDALDDAGTPAAEALIGFAGLAAIVAVAALAGVVDALVDPGSGAGADLVHAVAVALAGLAILQAMPGLPLDGGRLLRAIVWYLTDNPIAGARAAAVYAQVIAAGMIVFGIVAFASAGAMPYWGLWAFVGGWQLGGEARAGLFRIRWQRLARSIPVGELVSPPLSLPGGTTIDAALEALIDAGGDAAFLVLDGEKRPVGVLRLANLRACPRADWIHRSVAAVATPVADLPHLDVDQPAREALALLDEVEATGRGAAGPSIVVVAREGTAVAVLNRRVILRRLLSLDRERGSYRSVPSP